MWRRECQEKGDDKSEKSEKKTPSKKKQKTEGEGTSASQVSTAKEQAKVILISQPNVEQSVSGSVSVRGKEIVTVREVR